MPAATPAVAGKITLESFQSASSARSTSRPFGKIPPRRSFLIVCEGVQTEPNYFQAIASCLPRHMVENVVVEGVGGTPDYLLTFAQKKIDERRRNGQPPFYHVWLVFDRDKFEHFMDTITAVDRLNKANAEMRRSQRPLEHWHCAWSNEAFELWYVLHFREQLGGGVSRTEYQGMITEDVRHYTAEKAFKYEKNDPKMFDRLQPFTLAAIDRATRGLAKQMSEKGQAWDQMNPATCVHLLVKDLLAYLCKGQR